MLLKIDYSNYKKSDIVATNITILHNSQNEKINKLPNVCKLMIFFLSFEITLDLFES